MGLPPRIKKFTAAEYLPLERKAEYRSEFFDGEIFAIAGGSPRHSQLKANLMTTLGVPLSEHPCTL